MRSSFSQIALSMYRSFLYSLQLFCWNCSIDTFHPPSDSLHVSTFTMKIQLIDPFLIHHSDSPGLVYLSSIHSMEEWFCWWNHCTATGRRGSVSSLVGKQWHQSFVVIEFDLKGNHIKCHFMLPLLMKLGQISRTLSTEQWSSIFQLRRELIGCTQGSLSVSTYFTKIKGIWEERTRWV